MDTTGAGDAFAAALLAELAPAWPPDEWEVMRAMRVGLEVAGAVTLVDGAQARIPSEPER